MGISRLSQAGEKAAFSHIVTRGTQDISLSLLTAKFHWLCNLVENMCANIH